MLKKISGDVNLVNWLDIPVTNLERAKLFYETILNIKMEIAEGGPEPMAFFPRKPKTIMGLSGILSGALVKSKKLKPGKNGPLIYINASPSLQTSLAKVKKAGGKILVPRTKIPAGYIAVCMDSEGNKVGLHAAR